MSILSYLGGLFAGLLANDAVAPPPSSPQPPPQFDPRALYEALVGAGFNRDTVTPFQLYSTRPATPDMLQRIFAPAQPHPGVVPQGVRPMAMDDINNPLAYGGTSLLSDGMWWLGYPYLAELSQRPEYRLISDTLAKEMTRRWLRLQATGDDDKSDKIRVLEDKLREHKVQEKFAELALLDGFFGRAHLYIDTGVTEDADTMRLPLVIDPRTVPKGCLKALRVVEPMWVYPNRYNSDRPLQADFYVPQTWYVMSQEVHRTRLLPFIMRQMPDMLKPAYSFGGMSLSQMAKPYVDNWLRTRQSVSDLVHSFSTPVLMTNMGSVMNAGASAALQMRASLFNYLRDNNNMMVLDKTTEDFKNVSAPLGSIDHLQAQAQEHIASISGIPLVVLTGITPSGLNATSDSELQVWAQKVNALQSSFFDANLRIILDVMQLDEFGVIDPGITHAWEPLRELSEQEIGDAEKQQADTDAVYVNAGVLSPDEIRQRLASEPDSPYQGLDLSTPAPEPPQEEMDPLGGGSAPPGAAPGGGEKPAGPPMVGGGQTAPVATAAKPVRGVLGKPIGGGDDIPIAPKPPERTKIIPGENDEVHIHPHPTDKVHIKVGADAEFKEGDHPRDDDGKFGSGGGKAAPGTRGADHVKAKRDASGKLTDLPPHIAKLKIPPAWTDVSYNPDPKGALQALGKDAAGRVQPIYSDEHTMAQAAAKFARIHELNQKYADIKTQNDAALKSKDPKTRAAAEVMALVMHTGIRPGSEGDTGAKEQAYGATTLERRHVVEGAGGNVTLKFVGKKGVPLSIPVTDPAVAKMLLRRKAEAGRGGQLFPDVSNNTLLAHVHSFDGGGFKTKDFRTHLGTQTATDAMKAVDAPTDAKSYKKAVMRVAKVVSDKLGNTPSIALASYISPTVFAPWAAANV
jgi:hypothetical protein